MHNSASSRATPLGSRAGVALEVDRFRMDRVLFFRCLSSDRSGCNPSRDGFTQPFILHETAASGFETFISISLGGSTKDALPGTPGLFADANGSIAAAPEPATYSLLLAGLAVMAAIARRRRI